MHPWLYPLLVIITIAIAAAPVRGQQPVPGFTTTKYYKLEKIDEDHWRATGQVEFEKDDMKFFADQVDYYPNTHRLIGVGNVVYASKENRIAADRLDFDTETRLGTFYNASGSAQLTQNADKSMFGTQEPEAYFYGDVLEKVGPDKYRIQKGGFTTCLQPTPRWEISASSLSLTLNDYAIVHNSILRVKGVPLFYMPLFYYPVQDDDRATGFLIPTYGTSNVRGQSISNAFFWAISRSQDATMMHDWFSRTGQGYGGEYRYIAAPGSQGSVTTYILNEKEVPYTDSSGTSRVQPARESYQFRGSMTQVLPGHLRARADVDYFSDVTVQQLYQTNLYQATLRQRSYGGNLTGAWGADSVSATYNLRELFVNDDVSTLYGNAPRLAYVRAPRRMFGTPVYFSLGSEYNVQVRTNKAKDLEDDPLGLTRVDISPQLRFPVSKWPFLGLQGSIVWRNTYYSESQDQSGRIPDWIGRHFFDMRGEVIGPTFTRIFDTGNGFADKIKHLIEPNFTIQRTTLIDNYDSLVKLDSYDYTLGGTTQITYGVTNRLLAKKGGAGSLAPAREFFMASISQTYYSDELASQLDPSVGTSFHGLEPHKLSPWIIGVTANPSTRLGGGMRIEYDQFEKNILAIAATGQYSYKGNFQATSGWSRRQLSETQASNYLTVNTNMHGWSGKIGGAFSFDYDFSRDVSLQRRLQGFYNAQCCGVAFEYQTYNYPPGSQFIVPKDHRFNITFTLAGIGTFSNFFGVFGNPTSTYVR